MDINYVIAVLQHAKERDITRVMLDRDFVPVAEIDITIVDHERPGSTGIVVVKEVHDQFSPIRLSGGRLSVEEMNRRKRIDDAFAHKIKEAGMFQIPNKTQLQEYLEDVRNRL